MSHPAATRILIVKIGAIGDVVMALPILTAIRKKHSHSHITWLCGTQVASLIRATNLVDEIIEVPEKKLLAGSLFSKAFQLCKIWRTIGLKFYDLILTLHPDPRYRLLSFLSRCSCRKHWHPRPGRYHAEEYANLIGFISEPIQFPVIHTQLRSDLSSIPQPIVLIAPGGAKNVLADDALRRWPIDHYARLIDDLAERHISIVITGSDTDRWVLPFFPNKNFHNFIGLLNLLELIALLQHSNLLITHDSGPLHLAKIAHCPTIALFGPTHPKEKYATHEKITVIWGGEHLICRPCYNGKTYASCKNNACLSSISTQTVVTAALKMLNCC